MTSFDDKESKKMKEMLDRVRAVVATATPADQARAAEIRRSGAGLRVETIPPVCAGINVLHYNRANRSVSIPKVYAMVEDMESDDFKFHHQGVAYTPDGLLGDGQHRHIASAISGVELRVPVMSDFDLDAIDAIDRSTKRTAAQAAAMHGMVDAEAKMPIGRIVLEYLHQIEHGVKPRFSDQKLRREVTRIETTLTEAIRMGRQSIAKVTAPSMNWKDASIVAALCLARGWDEHKVSDYLTAVQQGIATYQDAPTLILSRKLLQARDSVNTSKRLTSTERIALACKAAKMWGKQVSTSKLAWDERKEGMPDPALHDAEELPIAAE
jgi:hypothetical protein